MYKRQIFKSRLCFDPWKVAGKVETDFGVFSASYLNDVFLV